MKFRQPGSTEFEGEEKGEGGLRHASPPPTFSRVNIMPLRGCVGASYEHSVNFSGFSPRYSRFGQSVGRPHGDRTCVESSLKPTVQYIDDYIIDNVTGCDSIIALQFRYLNSIGSLLFTFNFNYIYTGLQKY